MCLGLDALKYAYLLVHTTGYSLKSFWVRQCSELRLGQAGYLNTLQVMSSCQDSSLQPARRTDHPRDP